MDWEKTAYCSLALFFISFLVMLGIFFIVDDRSVACMSEKGTELCESKGLETSRAYRKEVRCVDAEHNPEIFYLTQEQSDKCFKEAWSFGVR